MILYFFSLKKAGENVFVFPKVELIIIDLAVIKRCHASLINRKVLPVAVTHYYYPH